MQRADAAPGAPNGIRNSVESPELLGLDANAVGNLFIADSTIRGFQDQ
jgi:hypothetical protein